MRTVKTLLGNLHRYLLCALVSALLIAWVYTLVTDAPARKKMVVYIDAPAVAEREMEEALSYDLPSGIRLVRVHSFEYDLIGGGLPREADIYIMPREDMEAYYSLLLPLEDAPDGAFAKDGVAYGIPVNCAGRYVSYDENREYFLCYRKASPHAGNADGAAFGFARRIMDLD